MNKDSFKNVDQMTSGNTVISIYNQITRMVDPIRDLAYIQICETDRTLFELNNTLREINWIIRGESTPR
jgi:hypothetical protein